MRILCSVLGVVVSVKQGSPAPENSGRTSARVLIANYTSTLDHLAIDLIIPNVLV